LRPSIGDGYAEDSLKVLLLNPAAKTRLQRAEISSTTTKARYYECPVDLLAPSGLIATEHDVHVIDAIVEELTEDEVWTRIQRLKPDVILALVSIASGQSDLTFLKRCKDRLGCKIILTGDICYIRPDLTIQAEGVDALCLQYPAAGILNYLRGEDSPGDIVYKDESGVHQGEFSKGPVSFPSPAYTAFPLKRYSTPIMQYSPFVSVLTSLSCPMQCAYCSHSSTTYRSRPLEEVFSELKAHHDRGIREVYFADLMFNSELKRTKGLCRGLIERKLRFSWYCQMRPDKIDAELLDLMKKSGCHTVMFGVESSDPDILRSVKREIDLDKIHWAFAECRRRGMRTLAYMLLGLPGETWESAQRSIDFVFSLDPDYLSVNLFAPRMGSAFMRRYKSLDELLAPQPDLDSTLTESSHCGLTGAQLMELRRRAIRRFYLRPMLLIRHVAKIKTFFQLREIIVGGLNLLLRN
jgi:uncharacterized radical SAM superfamily protein